MYLRQFDFVNFWLFFLDYPAPWGESSKWEVIKSLWDMKKKSGRVELQEDLFVPGTRVDQIVILVLKIEYG